MTCVRHAPSRLPSPCSLARPVPHRVTRHLGTTSIYKPGISGYLRIALSATPLFSHLSESPGVARYRSRFLRTKGPVNLQTCKLSCFQRLAHSLSPKIEHRSFFSTTCALFCRIPGGGHHNELQYPHSVSPGRVLFNCRLWTSFRLRKGRVK